MKISLFTHYDDVCLGLRIIAGLLEHHGHKVQLVFMKPFARLKRGRSLKKPYFIEHIASIGQIFGSGYDIDPLRDEDIELLHQAIKEFDPDMIGLSSRSILDDINQDILDGLREAFPGITLVAGGYGPSFSPERYIEHCDCVVVGEGEYTMLDIATALEKGDDPRDIPNVAYKIDGEYHRNPMRKLISHPDRLPPMKELTDNIVIIKDGKLHHGDEMNRMFYPMIYGRGCVRSCSYCAAGQWPSLYKELIRTPKIYRKKSLDGTFAELKRAKANNYPGIVFLDSFLVASTGELIDLFTRYAKDINLPFYATLHPSQVIRTPELLDIACEAGLAGGSIGIQSGSVQFAREVYDRRQSNKEILEYIGMLRKRELYVDYHFICGNPLETEDDIEESLKLIKKIPYDPNCIMSCMRLHTFPGTTLEKRFREKGIGIHETQGWLNQACLYQLRWICDDEEFESIRNNTTLLGNPYHMVDMIKRRRWEYLIENRIPNLSNGINYDLPPYWGFLMQEMDYKLHPEGIVIWGSDRYREFAHFFSAAKKKILVDGSSSRQGTTLNDLVVQSPDVIRDAKGPIFILSANKPAICEEIHKINHDAYIV
jgi:radical SAM superfamily enzyme YgiQ (UPF0313 family)